MNLRRGEREIVSRERERERESERERARARERERERERERKKERERDIFNREIMCVPARVQGELQGSLPY